MIDITDVNLIKFVKKVYDLSFPPGLGFLHYPADKLTDEEAKQIINFKSSGDVYISMDYIRDRACKMVVFKKESKMLIRDNWHDHTDEQLRELLLYSLPQNTPFPVLECNCKRHLEG